MPSAPPARDSSSPFDGITADDARPTVRQLSAAVELGRAARAAGGRLALTEELLLERIAPGESARRARLRTQAALHEAGLRAERAPDGRVIIAAARRRGRAGGRPWVGLIASAVVVLALAAWIFDSVDVPGGDATPTPTPTATATAVPTSSPPRTTAAVEQRRTEPAAKAPAVVERERATRAKRARERREAKAKERAEARRKRRARDRARCTRTERYIVRSTGDAPLGCEAFQRKMIQLRRIAPPRI